MSDFKNEMRDFKDEMRDFKNEMKDFKDEMRDFKDEMKLQIKELNKKWGELANKMGTLVEDIIAPGTPDALNRKFGIETLDLMVRRQIKDSKNNVEEFDIIVVGSDKKVYLIEVKSTPKVTHLGEIIAKANKLKNLLYPDKNIIPIIGSLYFPEAIIKRASKMDVYVMGIEGEYLNILN